MDKKEYNKKYYQDHREKCVAATEQWSKDNPDKIKEWKREWYRKNAERCREYSKKWKKENPEKTKEQQKNYRENNKEKIKESQKVHRENHRKSISLSRLKYLYGLEEDIRHNAKTCDVCGSTDFGAQGPNIDHDHDTKKIRGVVCRKCNLMLGHANDSIFRLQRGIDYLKKHMEG